MRWYVYDGLGSVLAEVDECGAINPDSQGNPTPLRKYDVYGGIRNTQAVAPGTSDHKFVGSLGHTSEAETGLIYMRARWYDPVTGRFISEDPKRDSANWFAYCENNVTSQVDPTGLFVEDVIKAERDITTLGFAKGKIAQAYGMALGNLIGAIVGTENVAISFNTKTSQMFYNFVMNGRGVVVRLDLSGHSGYPAHINTWIKAGQEGHMIFLDSIETLIDKLSKL